MLMEAREDGFVLKKQHMTLVSNDLSGPVRLCFRKSPSALRTLLQAIVLQRHIYGPGERLSAIEVTGSGIQINRKHLAQFNRIRGEQRSSEVSLLYPFAIVYPYILRLLSHSVIPLSIFRSLNTRNQVTIHRNMDIRIPLDVKSRLSDYRVIENGIEVDIISSVFQDNAIVWENLSTYYYRGKYGPVDDSFRPPQPEPVQNGRLASPFCIEAKDGFRFARLTGDTNGIHYSSFYARMLGFKGAFAQPVRVVSRCLQHMPKPDLETPARLVLFYKGPVYYNHKLTLMHTCHDKTFQFNLYLEDDERPCICGWYQDGVPPVTMC